MAQTITKIRNKRSRNKDVYQPQGGTELPEMFGSKNSFNHSQKIVARKDSIQKKEYSLSLAVPDCKAPPKIDEEEVQNNNSSL